MERSIAFVALASLFLPSLCHPAPGNAALVAPLAKRTFTPTPVVRRDVDPSVTSGCIFTSTSYPTDGPSASSYSAMGLTGEQIYCTCGETMAGINLATSGTSTTSYCAMGEGVPLGFTQIPADGNGHPISAAPAPTTGSGQCQDGSAVDSTCFNELDLPDYLSNWWSQKQGQCDGLKFSDCFYKIETKYAPSTCNVINTKSNCDQPKWDDFKGQTDAAQRFYVAFNIYQTNGFFTDMYNAIGNGEAKASGDIGKLAEDLNPPQKTNVALDDLLIAATFALSLYSEGTVLMKALLRTAPQTTGMLGKLFPTGELDQTVETWADAASQLGTVTQAFQNSVAAGLPILQDDVQNFIKWSQASGLSGNRPSLDSLSNDMSQALTAYATSRIMSDIGIVVARAPGIDVHDLQANHADDLNWDTGCSGGYTNGVCDSFFWDGTDTYSVIDPEHQKKNYHDVLVELLQGDSPKTTGQLLFTAAQACYARTGKNGDASPSIDQDDPTQLSCVSTMRICTWDENGFGPFDKSCPNLPSGDAALPRFGISGCIGETGETTSIDVPHAYLGPGLWKDGHGVEAVQGDSFCNNIDE